MTAAVVAALTAVAVAVVTIVPCLMIVNAVDANDKAAQQMVQQAVDKGV